jgi:hypothetical protein
MSDLPELKNEPTIGASRSDMEEFARVYRPGPEQRANHYIEPRQSRFRYAPTLGAILIALVGTWHWFAANHYEKELTRKLGNYTRENLPDASVSVDVHPLTNLIEIQVTRNVARREAAFEFLGDAIIEFVRQELEPKMERELSLVARRDVDLYAMMVPYRVSISVDKVRAPPPPPPSRMVQEIQRKLSAHGYDPGPADGRLGQRTRMAIEGFQRDYGLTVDGRATGELLEVLRKVGTT